MPAGSADIRALAERLQKASGEGIQKAVDETLTVYAERIKSEAQARAPFKSGRLKYSITINRISETSVSIGPEVPYGVFQEFGTGTRGEFHSAPYKIAPKGPGYLTFQVNGRWVRTKLVNHPGIPAHPFMRPALEAALGDFAAEMARKGTLLITKGDA